MITTEDRARAAMQAIGDTVRDAPPLELAPGPRVLPDVADGPAAGDEVHLGGHGARGVSACAVPAVPLVPAVPPVPAAVAGTAGGGQSWPRSPPRSRSRPSPSRW